MTEKKKLKIGIIGAGCRGYALVKTVCSVPDAVISAIADVYEDKALAAAEEAAKLGGVKPAVFTDYNKVLCCSDAVIVCTAWEFHAEIAAAAMRKGVIVGLDVGGAYNPNDCYRLIDVYEQTGTPFMFLENCCFDKSELLITNMVRKGVFGEIVHCSGAYSHDLREEVITGIEKRHYRFRNYLARNCENYPTHELGPIAKILNINRGNRITKLVSVASKAAGLKAYAKERNIMPDAEFAQGDVVNTIITCAGGQTIELKLDTTLPSFYDRALTVRGTKGLYSQTLNAVYLDKVHPENVGQYPVFAQILINNASGYEKEYLPDVWKNITKEQLDAGHGGMDAVMMEIFVKKALTGGKMPIDVYDAATWMSVSYLSEQSVLTGGQPQTVPDFTGGRWLLRPPEDVIDFD
ncbi:MAG: Gfo/Idh/MocA family oxidoreductase [Clostridia bacterium]|nr:Gfo/Idh/MocA family oxidoreductase [Clostridia bacterium]